MQVELNDGSGRNIVCLSVKTTRADHIPKTHRFPMDWHSRADAYACIEVKDHGPRNT